jgi:hypothetical protein
MDDTVAAAMTAKAGRWLKPSMLTGVAASNARPVCTPCSQTSRMRRLAEHKTGR